MDVTLRKGDFNPLYPEYLINREVEVAHDDGLLHYVFDEAPQFHMQCVDAKAKKHHNRFRAVPDDGGMQVRGCNE